MDVVYPAVLRNVIKTMFNFTDEEVMSISIALIKAINGHGAGIAIDV